MPYRRPSMRQRVVWFFCRAMPSRENLTGEFRAGLPGFLDAFKAEGHFETPRNCARCGGPRKGSWFRGYDFDHTAECRR